MKLTLIPASHVPRVWHLASPFLDAASRTVRQRHDIVDIFEECCIGKQLLWLIFDEENGNRVVGSLTTSANEYPQYTALTIPYMGGRGIWKIRDEIMDVLRRFARDNGFRTIECYGKDGWEKIGKKYGFKKAYTAFEVNVDDDI